MSSIEKKNPKRQLALDSVRRICKCRSSFVVDIKKLALQKSLSEVVRAFPAKKESVQIKIIHSKMFFFMKIDFMSE